MSNKYKVITGTDVLDVLISVDLDAMSPINCINLVNIAALLKTSRYQVKMYMDRLVSNGVAELHKTVIYGEDYVLPYCGYRITDTVRIKSGDCIDNSLDKTFILQTRAKYQRKKAQEDEFLRSLCNKTDQ
jgi:hypothetical protein